MNDETLDDKQEESTLDDSSPSTVDASADAVDGDNNVDEEVKVKKSEWMEIQKKLEKLPSIEIALEKEREKRQKLALSQEEDKRPRRNSDYEEWKKFREIELQEERQNHELALKSMFLKKYPAIAADNEYGIQKEVVEHYQVLLKGGMSPRTRDDVADLFTKAIRMVKPELFAQSTQDDLGKGYSGMSRGVPEEKEITQEPRLTPAEEKMHSYFNERLKKRGLIT